jgi:hypothetical protein
MAITEFLAGPGNLTHEQEDRHEKDIWITATQIAGGGPP